MTKLIDFYADWCGPCQAMKPILKEIEEEYKDKIEVQAVNVEENGALAGQYQVMSIPTFVIVENEQEKARKMGAMPKEVLKEWLDSNL